MTVVVTQNNITSPNANVTALTVGTANGLNFPNAGPLSNRNLIINGAMQVSQRGTTGTVTNAKNYLVDRYYGIAQNANVTQSQESSVVATGFKNSLKFEVTSAGNTGYLQCVQRIEGQNMAHLNFGTANAVQFTLSFYVRSSITGNYSIAFRNGSDNRSYVTTYNIATANTWERKTVTLTGDTTGTWATDNGHGMSVIWTLGYSTATSSTDQWTATANFAASSSVDLYETNGATWYLTGVQLEVGSVATPFEHRSYGDELARCQRYFMRYTHVTTGADGGIYQVAGWTSNNAYGAIRFPTTMRTGPSFSYNGGVFYTNGIVDSSITLTQLGSSVHAAEVQVTDITVSGGDAGWVRLNTSGHHMSFSAEL